MVQTRGPSKRKPSSKKEVGDDSIDVKKRGEYKTSNNNGVSTPAKVSGSKTTVSASKTKTPTKVTKSTPKKSPIIRKTPVFANDTNNTQEIRLNKITEQEILTANNSGDLINLINQLTSTAQDEIFNSYKLKTKMKLDQDEQTIVRLEEELQQKDLIIEELRNANKGGITTLNSNNTLNASSSKDDGTDLFISPIRKRRNLDEEIINRDDITKELNTIGVILDMIQLLTGLKVINHDQDDNNFYFDVIQNSTNDRTEKIVIEYRLVIVKKLSSATEVNYIPTFLETENKQREILKKYLPEYFCDDLTFPYKALSQFYGKMNKALNKITNR